MNMSMIILSAIGMGVAVFLFLFIAMLFRIVVSTNDVHIVQSAGKTTSYGKDQPSGNVYYKWPSWLPVIGVKVIVLPVSVFDEHLKDYAAYDKGRVPFEIDIMAFFRIEDSNIAAQRVHSFEELRLQLHGILQGASRSILAKAEIDEILEERARYGNEFTIAVNEQLKNWGVTNVKNIELMDIRDIQGSKVIENIMAKKKSLIERQSREVVAENIRAAQEAEIIAKREVALRDQEAQQQVGQRTAEKDKQIGIAKEKAHQDIKEQAKITAEKEMMVQQVQHVRAAEIQRDVQLVAAEQEKKTTIVKAEGIKQVDIVKAEGTKQQTVLVAEGQLEAAKLHAVGVEVEGKAKGAAEQAVLMAPVNTQITLAKEIGTNDGYQKYLLGIKGMDVQQVVGVAQADALKVAHIKVIANSGDVTSGVKDVMGLLTSKGGTQLGAMAEAFAQTETGTALLKKFGIAEEDNVKTADPSKWASHKGNGSADAKGRL